MTDPSQMTQAIPTTPTREGALRRAWRWLVGSHPRLRESEGRTSWLSYLLMLVQSLTLVLIGGSVELRTLLSGAPLPEKALMTLSLAVLVLGTYAADMCAQRTMGRISVLWRNRRGWVATEHTLYVAFVVGVEMATYAVALYVIETNPQALLAGASILPTTALVIGVMVGVRALIIAWTYVQLKVIADPLPANDLTLMRQIVEKTGGHADAQLDGLQLQARDLPTVLNAIAEMSKPPRRIPHWYNGWLRRRDAEAEAEQDALRARQIAALQSLTHDEVAEAQENAARQIAAAEAATQQAREDVQWTQDEARRQIAETAAAANTQATQRTLDAVLALVAAGKLPDWLIAERPDLADFSLASVVGAQSGRRSGNGAGIGGRAPNSVPARESSSPSQRQRAFLLEQGITPAAAPEGKRGVWLRASDLATLTGGKSGSETPQALIRRLGDGLKVGVAYVAPFEPTMRELAERHLLADAPRIWWASQSQSGDDTGMDAVGHAAANVIPMRA